MYAVLERGTCEKGGGVAPRLVTRDASAQATAPAPDAWNGFAELGKGKFGVVRLCTNRKTGQ
eukprot:1302036-Rhodomonas_salina.1